VALNRGRHLCSAGRPSRWALAHISSCHFYDESRVGCSVVVDDGFRCCEKTMQVMRANHDAILTIVQVLLYDPLYVWTISLVRGYQLQHRHATDADVTDANMNATSVDSLDQSVSRAKRQSLALLSSLLHLLTRTVVLFLSVKLSVILLYRTYVCFSLSFKMKFPTCKHCSVSSMGKPLPLPV